MRGRSSLLLLSASLIPAAVILLGQEPRQAEQSFRIFADSLPLAIAGQNYKVRLRTNRDSGTVGWLVVRGKLPTGFELSRQSGEVSGVTNASGDYRFMVEAKAKTPDPHHPERSRTEVAQQEFLIRIVSALVLQWKQPPQVDESSISGRISVTNNTGDIFDLTLIIVAIDEWGRANALAHQRLNLPGGSRDRELPFTATVPRGNYVVHADAVAEVPAKSAIYRARLQTRHPLEVVPVLIQHK